MVGTNSDLDGLNKRNEPVEHFHVQELVRRCIPARPNFKVRFGKLFLSPKTNFVFAWSHKILCRFSFKCIGVFILWLFQESESPLCSSEMQYNRAE